MAKVFINLDSDLFPEDAPGDNVVEFLPDDDPSIIVSSQAVLPYGFTWEFDFDKGDLDFTVAGDPKKLYNKDVVTEWVKHTLSTDLYETPIFGGDIGTVIKSLIGLVIDSYVISRCQDEVVSAISVHDRVVSVNCTSIYPSRSNIYATIEYETDDSQLVKEIIAV